MRYTALSTIMRPGATELEVAKASKALVSEIAPMLGPMVQRHAVHAVAARDGDRSESTPRSAPPASRCRERARSRVAFADLVGFTRLGEVVSAEELGQLADRLADLARDLTAPPVRFIKTIGDAVMLVCPEPAAIAGHRPQARRRSSTPTTTFLGCAAAWPRGMAVSRAGDWFGSPVNVASRVTGVARPGTVLVADSVARPSAMTPVRGTFAGLRRLKGIKGIIKLFRVRRG